MEAVVIHDFEEYSIADVPRPEPGADEALVEVDRVQLSITECMLYHGEEIFHTESVRDRLADGPARMFGHEFCGRIVEAGDDVTRFEEGDRVYASGKRFPCHECAYCRRGMENYCLDSEELGYDRPGGLAEYTVASEHALSRLPDGVSDAEGAAMQPFGGSVLAVRDADIDPGDTVLVVGTGVMGYQCGQLSLEYGAGDVYAVDVVDGKLGFAADRGMRPIDAREEDPAEWVLEATDGIGADVVFEAVGGEQAHANEGSTPLSQCFDAVRYGGTVVQVGNLAGDVPVTPRALRSKNVSWVNPTRGVVAIGPNADDSGEFAAELVASGRVSIGEYVAHELDGLGSFEEAVEITLNKGEYGALGPAQIELR